MRGNIFGDRNLRLTFWELHRRSYSKTYRKSILVLQWVLVFPGQFHKLTAGIKPTPMKWFDGFDLSFCKRCLTISIISLKFKIQILKSKLILLYISFNSREVRFKMNSYDWKNTFLKNVKQMKLRFFLAVCLRTFPVFNRNIFIVLFWVSFIYMLYTCAEVKRQYLIWLINYKIESTHKKKFQDAQSNAILNTFK